MPTITDFSDFSDFFKQDFNTGIIDSFGEFYKKVWLK